MRTNLSSFFIIDNLIKISNELANENIYAGIIGNHNDILFGSGAAFWLTKDNIIFIINNKDKLDILLPDDVAIGLIMKNKIKTQLTRYDLTENINFNNKDILLNTIIVENNYHIRIKNFDRQIDLELFTEFTNHLYIN